jgi:prepilin-type N-terminal cleavage/methylation domain-containing protein
MTRRRGVSLIELILVIAIITAILGMTGTLFHRLFQSEQRSARATLVELTTSRLADQFRRDVHWARTAKQSLTPGEMLPILELTVPATASGGDSPTTVVYTAGDGKVARELIGSQGTMARESFRLPDCRVRFSELDELVAADATNAANTASAANADTSTPLTIVSLVIERPHATVTASQPGARPLRALAVDAELGRDDRLTAAALRPAPAESTEEPQ